MTSYIMCPAEYVLPVLPAAGVTLRLLNSLFHVRYHVIDAAHKVRHGVFLPSNCPFGPLFFLGS